MYKILIQLLQWDIYYKNSKYVWVIIAVISSNYKIKRTCVLPDM